MRTVVWLTIALTWLAFVGSGVGRTTPVAYACSAGEDFDPVAQSDLIVIGQITAWTPRPELRVMEMFTPVELTIDVWSVVKGSAGRTITVIDQASYAPDHARMVEHKPLYRDEWLGSSGACGAFDSDPAGAYVILGLNLHEDGTYRTSRPISFYVGAGTWPLGPGYQLALQRVGAEMPIRPPGTGSAGLLARPN